ncbi:hypothetical protein HMPREF9439_01217 [Parasutterella excrementihominis YIT 11859]|uniref:Uncharacterized protein n=1 Tax=Parasutterella excrementihominis YIT 11859 TaxID=762966 RepID=F3QJW0_9BURK|nr:hypothetical protein HMPREF9439_01217 [Parasutterella excrementihominis YIT 11859]
MRKNADWFKAPQTKKRRSKNQSRALQSKFEITADLLGRT